MASLMISACWLVTAVVQGDVTVTHRELSGTMVSGVIGDVFDMTISPDGSRVLYRVTRDTEVFGGSGLKQLHVAPVDDSAVPIALTSPELNVVSMLWTADGSRAVFVAETGTDVSSDQLYSVETDGSAAPILLFPMPEGSFLSFPPLVEGIQPTADGSRVAYLLGASGVSEIYSVPVDGSAPPLRLCPSGQYVLAFATSPSGSDVVYKASQGVNPYELYSVPADGSTAPVKISDLVTPQHVLGAFVLDPTGTRAVYRAEVAGRRQVFSAPIDASSPAIQLSESLVSDHVESFQVGPDGANVVYRAGANGPYELFIAPLDGSSAAELLVPIVPGGQVQSGYRFAPDGSHVVYGAIPEDKTFSVRTSDGVTAVLTSGTPDFHFSPDSTRVVLRVNGLSSVPIGGGALVGITPELVPGGGVHEIVLTPDSHVVYRADAETDGVDELYRVELVPSGAPVATKLSPVLAAGGDVFTFRVAPDSSHVVFRANANTAAITELLRSFLAGPPDAAILSDPLPEGEIGDVAAFAVRNGRAVYAADQDTDGKVELYGVPSSGSAPAVKLSGGGQVVAESAGTTAFQLSADGTIVVFLEDANLYSAPSDGSAPAVKLNGPLSSGIAPNQFRISADGTRVVYRANQVDSPGLRLHAVPIQGGASTALGLSSARFELTPDSSHVLFVNTRLYAQPIDGSLLPVDLSGAVASVGNFGASADGSRVAFLASSGGATRLFGNSITGGVLVDLGGALVSGGNVEEFAISPGGGRVVFLADAQADERFLLYSVPIDAIPGRIVLNGAMVGGGDVLAFRMAPDGVHVVYLADQDENSLENLYRVPIDGSAPSTRLSTADVADFELTPDGTRILAEVGPTLSSLAMTGGSFVLLAADTAPVRRITDNSSTLVYQDVYQGFWALLSVPMTGGPSTLLTPLSASHRLNTAGFQLDGRRVLYRATENGALGLHASMPWYVAKRTH